MWRESHASSAVLAGLLASIPAALVSALLLTLFDVAAGVRPGSTLLRIGLLVAGEESTGTLWLSAIGLHLAVSAVLGLVWGGLVAFTAHHLNPAGGAIWGGFFGLVVWLVLFVLVLPWLHPTLAAATSARTGMAWHVAWGMTLGAAFHFMRAGERRRHRPVT